MRRALLITALVAIFSGLTFGDAFSGKLIDVTCALQQQATTSCAPTSSTTAFGLAVESKLYKFDASGNAKAADALKSYLDRKSVPEVQGSGSVNARVLGTLEGDILKVESIELH